MFLLKGTGYLRIFSYSKKFSVTFLLGLPFTCPAGIHMFTLFNASAPSWNLLLFALLEVVVVAWLYGAENFLENVSGEMGIKLNRFTRLYWTICWKWLTPGILVVLLLMAWATFGHVTYEDGYVYPIQVQILGYLITGCTVIWIPVNLKFNKFYRDKLWK